MLHLLLNKCLSTNISLDSLGVDRYMNPSIGLDSQGRLHQTPPLISRLCADRYMNPRRESSDNCA